MLHLRGYRIFPLSLVHSFHIPTDYLWLDYSPAYDSSSKMFSDKLFYVLNIFNPPPYTKLFDRNFSSKSYLAKSSLKIAVNVEDS